MLAYEIINYLETYFPLDLQQPWDKCGVQIGNVNNTINKVMVALNADLSSLQLAIEQDCQMLITHHPFMLEEITSLDYTNHHGKFVELASMNNIVVYSLHTCLDKGKNGISMNDWLINALDVHDVRCYDEIGIGKGAILNKPCYADEFAMRLKETFKMPVKYAGQDKLIKTIAICGGSGAEDIEQLAGEVDAYITGDTKHRHAKYAFDHDILLFDVPHHVEVIMEEKVKKLLASKDVLVITAHLEDYYTYK